MDFLSFFGLKEDPFKLTPDPAYFYPSLTHNEGLLLLDYSIEQKEGFTTVIGDPGSGKTTLLNVFLEKWKARAEIAMVLTPRLSPEEFLVSVLDDLNIGPKRKNKNEIIKAFRDFMIEKSAEGKWVIIIVDEAQNLPDETLEELRLLSNLETDKDKLLQIVLLGQPELEMKLRSDKLRQLNQRITTRIHLKHFNPEETLEYINYRIIKAGKKNLHLDKKAGRLAYKLSKGVPRLINMLISRALMAAYLEESNIILPRHISHAVKSLNHSEMKLQSRFGLVSISAVAAALLLIITAAVNFSLHHSNQVGQEAITKTVEATPVSKSSEAVAVAGNNEKIEGIISPPPSLQKRGKNSTEATERSLPEQAPKNIEDPSINKPSGPDTVTINNEVQIPEYRIVYVKVSTANVREKPELDSKKVGLISSGSQLVVLQEYVDGSAARWYQVPFEGEKRWISEEVVDVIDVKKTEGQQAN